MDTELPNNAPVAARGARRHLRVIIAVALILLGAVGVLYPFLPAISYRLRPPKPVLPYGDNQAAASLLKERFGTLPTVEQRAVPDGHRLVIPTIGVNVEIIEGQTEAALDKGGVWRIPSTSTPDQLSNTVISGHRWKYLPPSSISLYLLDKVKDGDPMMVLWDKKVYTYRVRGREIVTPDRTDILHDTDTPTLTIFTCTPLFSTSHRLVLYADLIS